MSRNIVLQNIKRSSLFAYASVLVLSMLLPIALSNPTGAAALDNRSIDMSATQTSAGSGRDGGDAFGQNVTYTVSFQLGQAHANLEGIVVHFCTDSPIVGDACTDASSNGFDLATPTVSANANANATVGATDIDPSGWTVGGDNTDYLILSDATGSAGSAGDTVAFDIDGITNPTTAGTFYARITTYDDSAVAAAYTDPTVPESTGSYLDEGGIALSVANELTVTARVQEVLEFCVGTENASSITPAAGDDCTNDVAGTNLDLGVVDSNSIATTTGTTEGDGVMMVRTNALNGATVYYKAEQDTGANPSGHLKQANADCSGGTLADPCFNSVNAGAGTRAAISSGTEAFGVALKERITTTGGATNALRCNADYYGDGTITCTGAVAGNNYAWLDTGAFDTLASSTGPIDDELVALEFAATASPTTPTGIYTVTANFVATGLF